MKLLKPQRVDATTGNLLQSIIAYTIPLILGTLVQTCFNAIDLAVLGNMADSKAVASVGAASMIIALLVNSFIGIAGGAKIILAHDFGAKNCSNFPDSKDAENKSPQKQAPAAVFETAAGGFAICSGLYLIRHVHCIVISQPSIFPCTHLISAFWSAKCTFARMPGSTSGNVTFCFTGFNAIFFAS